MDISESERSYEGSYKGSSERRNTKKQKRKRNKKYPYKKGGRRRTLKDSSIIQED
jgi:hypothetical protein